jgi:trk system potassium uptake protein TrkH
VYFQVGHFFGSVTETVFKSLFQAVSMITTTGFTTAEYAYWPSFLPVLLIFSSFMGGCAGSTAGGMKVVRVLLLFKQGTREILRLIHPSARISVKLNRKPVPDSVLQAVWGFFSVYIGVFVVLMLLVMATGLDQITAFSAVAAALNNLGPGLGEVASNFAPINDFAKWLLSFAMLLGRLEIFTLLVVLTPMFWRQ